jgi:hypothetical protein
MLEQHYIRTESNAALAWQLCSPTEQNWINEERAKCLDQRYYLENYHFITTEDGVLKSLYPFWDHQEMVYEAMEEEWAADGKCCLIILKPRQTGISTWVAGAMFHRTITMPHCFTMLMAQNKETATHIYQMSIKAYYNLPWWLRPEYQYQTKTGSIVFQRENETERLLDPGLGSELHVANATQMSGVAIGRTLRCLHMSEASRYPNDEVYEADVRPSTRGARDLFAVMESTAYGRQGLFYEQWQAAIDGDGDFKPLFIPVYKVTKYYLPIRGKGFDLADDERNFNERVKREEHFDIPDEFWNFRRKGLRAAKRGGNKAGFLESYPLTPMEAFQSSGLCAFDRDSLEYQELNHIRKPLYAGEITLIDMERRLINTDDIVAVGDDEILPRRKSGQGGKRMHVWEMPERGDTYYVSGDISLGNGGDYTALTVYRAGNGREPDTQVASWLGWIPPKRAAHVVAAIGIWYNDAEVAVEYMKDGITTGNELRDMDYPNLYRPQWKDRINHQASNYLHWLTTSKTRDEIIGCMNEALLDHTVVIRDADLLDEMIDFAAIEGSRIEGQGNNDDLVMSAQIGLYCLRETTRHLRTQAVREDTNRIEDNIPKEWLVFDNLMRQRGQYPTKAQAEKAKGDRAGWTVKPVVKYLANTLYSPIFDGAGAERDLHRGGLHSTEITPDLVYAFKNAMSNFGGPGSSENSDEW